MRNGPDYAGRHPGVWTRSEAHPWSGRHPFGSFVAPVSGRIPVRRSMPGAAGKRRARRRLTVGVAQRRHRFTGTEDVREFESIASTGSSPGSQRSSQMNEVSSSPFTVSPVRVKTVDLVDDPTAELWTRARPVQGIPADLVQVDHRTGARSRRQYRAPPIPTRGCRSRPTARNELRLEYHDTDHLRRWPDGRFSRHHHSMEHRRGAEGCTAGGLRWSLLLRCNFQDPHVKHARDGYAMLAPQTSLLGRTLRSNRELQSKPDQPLAENGVE